jgi:hypothetical protein
LESPALEPQTSQEKNIESSILATSPEPTPVISVVHDVVSAHPDRLMLTVSELVGRFYVVVDSDGTQYALLQQGLPMACGAVIPCRETDRRAEVRLGWTLPRVDKV